MREMPEIIFLRDVNIAPLKETPQHISLVQLPPVGKINGKDVTLFMHKSPTKSLINFFRKKGNIGDVSIEIRLPTQQQHEQLAAHPIHHFLDSVRLIRDMNLVPAQDALEGFPSRQHPIDREQALQYLSVPNSPATLSEIVGYNTGFVRVADMLMPLDRVGQSYLVGCNQFRLGSDTLSQDKLNVIARELEERIFLDEIAFASLRNKWNSSGQHSQGNNRYYIFPLDKSYVPVDTIS